MHLRTLENVSIVFVLIRTTKMSVQLLLSQELHIKLYLAYVQTFVSFLLPLVFFLCSSRWMCLFASPITFFPLFFTGTIQGHVCVHVWLKLA